MLSIDSSFLPTAIDGDYTAHLTQIALEENTYAPLVAVDFGQAESLVLEAEEEIALPADWESVEAVTSNGQTFQPASNPEDPQNGEFVYNPYSNTVQVYGDVGRSLQVFGKTKIIRFFPPLLPPAYPQLFTNLPLTGTIQFTRQFEQQPSAQFELELTLSKGQIQDILAPGTELDLYGLPLRINSISITELKRAEYPDARCRISVSLGSRWENYLDEPCFLRSDGRNYLPSNDPFQDPECTNGQGSRGAGEQGSGIAIQQLLAKIGIPYIGPNLALVDIPQGTPRDATVNPVQLMEERLRVANSFVRWSNATAVEVVPITSMRAWNYAEADITSEVETSFEAIAKLSKKRLTSIANYNPPPPDLINFPATITPPPLPQLKAELPTALAFEYPNSELTGEFTEPQDDNKERTQGQKPRYVRKSPKREERIDGDKNAHVPLEGVESIQNMSLIFDIGGQTKTRSTTITEDGATVQVVDEIWGFAATAIDMYDAGIYDPVSGKTVGGIRGNPIEVWKCIKKTSTDYTYDKQTGYLLSTATSGYNTVRYKQESADNPETLSLQILPQDQEPGSNEPTFDPEYFLYLFIQIPVIGRTSYYLRLMPDYSTEGLFELVKVCNRDGTSTVQPLINPDYAPPYYVEYERTESVAFASRDNPENNNIALEGGIGGDPEEDPNFVAEKYLPPLIVGEEFKYEVYTQVTEAVYQQKIVSVDGAYPTYERGEELSPQKFAKYIKQFKAQGQAIASAVEEISIEEGTGELPLATRRPPLYVKEEPQQKPTKTEEEEQQYRYFLQTDGYTAVSPINGSENFAVAKTLNEALIAAKCKLAIENWRNGFTETLTIGGNLEIKEGDRFNYLCNGEYRQRVVLGVQTTLNILGVVNGVPKVTYVTSLTLGRWMLPELTYNKVPVPAEPKAPGIDVTVLNVVSAELGSIIDWTRVRSRRNPQPTEQ